MERNQKKMECQKKAGDAIEVSMEREVDQNKKKEQEATACTEERYWEWLCSVPRLYYPLRALLLEQFGGPGNIYDASEKALRCFAESVPSMTGAGNVIAQLIKLRSPEQIAQLVHKREALGIKFISREHTDYPKRLRTLQDAPHGLFYRGELPDEEHPAVAIVGSRVCTHYGRQIAEQLAEQIAFAGGTVISGAAYGVDGAAQWKALEAGGTSCAIVGSGVEIYYPKKHSGLFQRLEQEGGVISEFPPGTQPIRTHFPMRNRIISGLSDVVVVVEARYGSGSLITADYALEQGRSVMAVPGRLDDELSRGCNALIAQGAGVILSAESFCEQIFPDYRQQKKRKALHITLAPSEKLVYSSLGLHSKSLWELLECTSLSPAELSGCLLSLEQKGLAREVERNYYVKV